ncbi:hypothetical protein [Streptosporangium carneum]|uniref:Uncharacterized protein n=1 Tax=Streptosporangium carneum TaxID=47481 RepID=A0A9W6HYS9_9ACTN|nr:hypothetical protein [Streptosporangium carneum]GLK07864.1 hypothetical protein GCM10017600_12690 [Streptosporangium carneum]
MRALGWAGVGVGTAMTLVGLYGMAVVPTTEFHLPTWAVPVFIVGLLLDVGASSLLFHVSFNRMWDRSLQAVLPGAEGGMGGFLSAVSRLSGEDDLLVAGLPGRADILAMTDTGMSVNDCPVVRFRLAVRAGEAEPYVVDHRQTLPRLLVGAVLPGRGVSVRVDPADPGRLTVDWARGVDVPAPSAGDGQPGPSL